MKDYRQFLKAIGRKPIDPGTLRTRKTHGVEIVRDRRAAGGWRLHRYEEDMLS